MNRIIKDIEMDDIFVKSYMKGLQNSTDESKIRNFMEEVRILNHIIVFW